MANYVKKSFGKDSLRLCSMLLAVLMLVLTVFVGTAPINAKAEEPDLGNVIKIGVGTPTAGLDCGQKVVLEAGKTYLFSYYYSGPAVVAGLLYDGNDSSTTVCTPTKALYDDEYNKVTYEFVAPETAVSAGEEGKVIMFLGVQVPTNAEYYFYSPCVYAKDDATKTNLFYDSGFTGKYTLKDEAGKAGNWHRAFGGVLGNRYARPNLESLGGMDFFKKTDADRKVIKVSGAAYGVYFGQDVTLEKGKTYTFAFNYTGKEPDYLIRIQDGSWKEIEVATVTYDTDLLKKYITFTVPAVYDNVAGENLTVYVGICGMNNSFDSYYSDFKLFDIENPEINIFKDGAFLENGDDIDTAWKEPSKALQKTYFTEITLEAAGGSDIFKKADRKVVMAYAESREYFGQEVTLEKGKTYTFSHYYTGWNPGYLIRIQDGSYTTIDATVKYDNNLLKKYLTFTVPAVYDNVAGSNMTVYVGIVGSGNPNDAYYYDLRLYEEGKPQCNFFKDDTFSANGDTFDSVWKHPSKALQNWFEKTTLQVAGGMDIFTKPANAIKIDNYKNVSFGQNVVLEAGKTYAYSYYYSGPALLTGLITGGYDQENASSGDLSVIRAIYDDEYNKVTYEFVAPEGELSAGEEGKVVIYLGIQVLTADTYYYCLPSVYAVDDESQTNLFNDYKFSDGNTLTGNWYKNYSYNTAFNNKFSCQTLEELGGMEFFEKTDADRFVLKLEPDTTGQPYFGQRVTLESGKTYIYSNCYLDRNEANQEIYVIGQDDSREQLAVQVINDEAISRSSVKFTVPYDESGSKVVYVGFRGNKSDSPLYYYDFRLYEEDKPEDNLLADYALLRNTLSVDTTVWKSPSNAKINDNYSKVTLASIGGMSAFSPYKVKCDLTGDGIVDLRDLIRMKKYSAGMIDSLPEGTGDLDCDMVAGDAPDFILLIKELLK